MRSGYYGKVTVEHPRPSMALDPEEPCLIVRAQDELYPDVVAYYLALCRRKGAQAAMLRAHQAYTAGVDWQTAHPDRVKLPD
jgi:hypothetical protein